MANSIPVPLFEFMRGGVEWAMGAECVAQLCHHLISVAGGVSVVWASGILACGDAFGKSGRDFRWDVEATVATLS
jgi:hypothetical protein